MENNNQMNTTDFSSQPNETANVQLIGHYKIYDPNTKEVFVEKKNAIHYENFSVALGASIANLGYGMIEGISFGNGGSRVDPSGIITYLTPNNTGTNAGLYNQTYFKIIDAANKSDIDPSRNYVEIRHVVGTAYTDVFCSVLLDFGEPSGQAAFDNSQNLNDAFVFDEIGIKAYSQDGVSGNGKLLTHAIFHPVQKALNRAIQIDYTIRIQTLSIFNG